MADNIDLAYGQRQVICAELGLDPEQIESFSIDFTAEGKMLTKATWVGSKFLSAEETADLLAKIAAAEPKVET